MEPILVEADSTSELLSTPPMPTASPGTPTHLLAKLPENVEYFNAEVRGLLEPGRELALMAWLQSVALVPRSVPCPAGGEACRMTMQYNSRAVDRVTWVCGCGGRRPVRPRSAFAGLGCSMAHALQILLAWTEDRHYQTVATALGVKEYEVVSVYERAERAAGAAWSGCGGAGRLGGAGVLVLCDVFPACRTHASPHSTDQHSHSILMLADTTSIPTRYYLHVMSDQSTASNKESAEISSVLSRVCERDSTVLVGAGVPEGIHSRQVTNFMSLATLAQKAPDDIIKFIKCRLWREAVSLCVAARDVCAGAGAGEGCGPAVQRYLLAALYRRHDARAHLYTQTLALLARHYTQKHKNPDTHTTGMHTRPDI